ncbi:MAG: 4-(cytidine 5'-diphospho)-2-C-methyl-D-erythritol kinase [Bacteroidaceae bacterium]|nr:4-(cytidine 5'-diphospho)-2-C-methyl-D-erythritol kinase [Bacteroidaceae bacterium]
MEQIFKRKKIVVSSLKKKTIMILSANAKINLGLHITAKRPDGYHNLETIFYPIPLADDLEILSPSAAKETELHLSGIPIEGATTDNLIIKAYHLVEQRFSLPPVSIYLHKNIPTGAGLGGGSSDATHTIKLLNQLFELKLTTVEQEKMVSQLGADCPFFVENKPVYATGTGNLFTPLDFSLKGYYLLLVKPDVFVSTKAAFSRVRPQQSTQDLPTLLKQSPTTWKESLRNDFETSVFSLYPSLLEIKEQLYKQGAVYASMSGSGSSIYGIFKENCEALTANYAAHFCRSMPL